MTINNELVVTITEIIQNIANMEETDQEIAIQIINIVRLYLLRDGELKKGKGEPTIYGGSPESPRVLKETAQIVELIVLIQKVWKEYQDLQDQYRRLTGRQYEWLR